MGARARVAANDDALPLGTRVGTLPRRGLRRDEAALYVGVSARKFDAWVAGSVMPKPIRRDGVVVWDVRSLDLAFDALGADDAGPDDGWSDFDGQGRA